MCLGTGFHIEMKDGGSAHCGEVLAAGPDHLWGEMHTLLGVLLILESSVVTQVEVPQANVSAHNNLAGNTIHPMPNHFFVNGSLSDWLALADGASYLYMAT